MKRCFDIFLSLIAGLILAVPFMVLIVLVRYKLGRPVFFTQERPGLQGQPFRMVKFRTMTNERGSDGELLPDTARLTRFGRFLRSTSLDELPELWNVFKGEMSLVGPRPLLVEYLPLYSVAQRKRHDVLPGITGWAQVQGRNQMGWEERFECDLWYVQNLSFALDIKIIVLTLMKIVNGSGVNAEEGVTMKKFTGSNS